MPGKQAGQGRCGICDTLPPSSLMELDALLGDPAAWPSSVWGLFDPPKGGLPASYRRFGAQRVGREWLDRHGWDGITTGTLRRHIRYDVAHVTRDVAELVTVGIISTTRTQTRIPTTPTIDAGAFISYFNAGVQMGAAAQRLLAERINAAIDAGDEPDPKLVMKLADMGASFAKTQATLVAKGLKFGEDESEDEAFRGSEDDLPSPRMGHQRVRTVNGERQVVRDEGPKDRERYNKRAREEGSTGFEP